MLVIKLSKRHHYHVFLLRRPAPILTKPYPSLSATLRHCPAWVALIALLCVGQTLQEYQLSQDWVISRLAVFGVWPPLMRSQCDPDLSNVETGTRNATS